MQKFRTFLTQWLILLLHNIGFKMLHAYVLIKKVMPFRGLEKQPGKLSLPNSFGAHEQYF